MPAGNQSYSTSRCLRNGILITSLLLAVAFVSVLYIYKDEKSPKQVLTAAYYKVFGLPVVSWVSVAPETEGISKTGLEKFEKSLGAQRTKALIIVRGGHIVFEWYADNISNKRKFWTAAMAKAVTATPVLLAALSENRIHLDEPLWKYYPEIENKPLRSDILIKHLAFHTSGIEDVDFYAGKNGELGGWKKDYYENRQGRFHYALESAPVLFMPGTRGEYSGVGFYALAYAVTKSIQGEQHSNIRDYLREKVMSPLDIPDNSWQLNYGESYLIDGMELYAFGSGAAYTARATARIGELMLNNGVWRGMTLLNADWIDQVLARAPDSGPLISENHGWTLNKRYLWPSLPPDAYAGLGGDHQVTLVVPSLDIVMVRYGESLTDENNDYHVALDNKLFKPLMESITGTSNASRH